MSNRYAAVAKTYPQRLFSGGLTAMWAILLPVMIVIPFLDRNDSRRTSLPLTLLIPAVVFTSLLAFHLRQLAIDASSRLLPRPLRAALVVAGACAAAYLIGLPLLLNLRGGAPFLWTAALLWLCSAAVFHFIIRPSLPITAVLTVAYGLSFMDPSPIKAWLAAADDPLMAWLLLLVSVVWFAMITRWLLQMNEESRGYTALSSGQLGWKAREASTEQTNRPWQLWPPNFSCPTPRCSSPL